MQLASVVRKNQKFISVKFPRADAENITGRKGREGEMLRRQGGDLAVSVLISVAKQRQKLGLPHDLPFAPSVEVLALLNRLSADLTQRLQGEHIVRHS
jgi:hypothetical protein